MKKKESKPAAVKSTNKQKAPAPLKLKVAAKNAKDGKSHPDEEPAAPPARNSKRGQAATPEAVAPVAITDPGKMTRVALIKARHEAMKREIDQIREDLESEEEE